MAVGCVAIHWTVHRLGARSGYSPRRHGRWNRARRLYHIAHPHFPLLRLVCGFSLLRSGHSGASFYCL